MTVRFGEHGYQHSVTTRRAFAGRLVAAYKIAQRTVVGLYDLEPDVPSLLLRMDVAMPATTVLDLWPAHDGLTLVGWDAHERTATAIRLDLAGRELTRVTVGAIALPVVDGGRLVAQRDDDTVRVTPLDGGPVVDLDIDAVSQKAAARPKAPVVRDNRGPGRVLAGRGRTLLVPWHGETVLDLDAAVALDRKLPAKTARLREVVTGLCREHGEALLECGHVHLSSMQVKAKGLVTLTFWTIGARDSSQRVDPVIVAFREAIRALDGHSLMTFGGQG